MNLQFADINSGSQQEKQRWFDQRRHFFIRQVLADFVLIFHSYQDLYLLYMECRKPGNGCCSDLLGRDNEELRGQIWDRLTLMVGTEVEKGPLWNLKDLCHRIWPEGQHGQNLDGSLVDWLIGSIFHEAMKLKENIYILNRYGPIAFRFSESHVEGRLSELRQGPLSRLTQMMDINTLINRIIVDVVSQMEQLAFLFGQASYLLRIMLPGLSGNMLVIRFLVEQEEAVREIWGETAEELFSDMFCGAPEQGFCAAGRSYLGGQWYNRSLAMYRRALCVDSGCDEAIAKVCQLQAVIRQNSQLLGEYTRC